METNYIDTQVAMSIAKYTTPYHNPGVTQRAGKVVPYITRDNLQYPDELLRLASESPLHASIINFKTAYTAGAGLSSTDEATQAFIDTIGGDAGVNELLENISYDLNIFDGFSVIVKWSTDWNRIVDIKYIDFSKIRLPQINDEGDITECYYSNVWRRGTRKYVTFEMYNPTLAGVRAKNYAKAKAEKDYETIGSISATSREQVYYFKTRNRANLYYPAPDYVAGIPAIATESSIIQYNGNLIRNGVSSDMMITLISTDTDSTEAKKTLSRFHRNYTGAVNAGSPVLNVVRNKEDKPIVDTFNNDKGAEKVKSLKEMTQDSILNAHGITSPVLVGIKTPGQLGVNEEIKNSFNLFYNSTIKKKQQKILGVFNKLLKVNGLEEVTIIRTNPFEGEDTSKDNENGSTEG